MWYFNDKPFLESDIDDYYGFVYIITNKTNNRKYIGRKYFWSVRTLKPLKGKKRKRKKKSISDWQNYYGSCNELLEDIEKFGKTEFHREILSLHKDKRDVNYSEIKEQFRYNVLEEKMIDGNRAYYNSNIMSKYFMRPEFVSDKTRRKLSLANQGKIVTDLTRKKISESLKGKPKPPVTDSHRHNISCALAGNIPWNKGMIGKHSHTEETKSKMSEDFKKMDDNNASVKTRFQKGHVPHNKNKHHTEETRKKISESLSKNSYFIKNNPNNGNNWYAEILFNDGIHTIKSPKSYCENKDIKYNALRAWSKKNLNNNILHPKYNIKILEIYKVFSR